MSDFAAIGGKCKAILAIFFVPEIKQWFISTSKIMEHVWRDPLQVWENWVLNWTLKENMFHPGTVAQICNSSTWEAEAEELEFWVQPGLQRPYLKKIKNCVNVFPIK
jgi:hypothetical protein